MDAVTIAVAFAISTAIVGALFLPGIRLGLGTADEAYLHFGSVNVLEGKIPVRDFRAYDPGRYYWCALWMRLLGPTFLSQRLAMGLVMVIALTLCCSWIVHASQSWTVAVVATLLAYTWMRPYFKAFEILFSLVAVIVAFLIITEPGTSVYLLSGITVGLALIFGLNIGLYAGLSFLLALGSGFFMHGADASAGPVAWMALGVVVAICPLLLLGFAKPGYFSTYWEKKVVTVLKRGASNLPLPLPWLWSKPAHLDSLSPARRLFFKLVFTGLLPLYLVSLAVGYAMAGDRPTAGSLVVSASLVGLVYLHHLFSRADVSHMWQTIHPAVLLVNVLALAFLSWPWAALLIGVLVALSAWAIIPQWDTLFDFMRKHEQYVAYDTGREILKLSRKQAAYFTTVRKIIDTWSTAGASAFFAPNIPGFYQLFDRQPALYDVFCVYPETDEYQSLMIDSLSEQGASIIIIHEQPIDRNDKLVFSRTHALVWRYLNDHYAQLESTGLPGYARVFYKTGGG